MTSINTSDSAVYGGNYLKVTSAATPHSKVDVAGHQEETSPLSAVQTKMPPVYSSPLISNKTASDVFALLQHSESERAGEPFPTSDKPQSAADKFLELMEMTPEERMFVLRLEQMGYTQEEFESLPPEEQEEISEQIRADMRAEIENEVTSDTGTAEHSGAPAQTQTISFDELAAKYDVTNLSPNEVDQLAKDLQASGGIPSETIMFLQVHGAEFLSHLPGEYYTPQRLNEGIDLLAHAKWQRSVATGPKENWDSNIALLEKLKEKA